MRPIAARSKSLLDAVPDRLQTLDRLLENLRGRHPASRQVRAVEGRRRGKRNAAGDHCGHIDTALAGAVPAAGEQSGTSCDISAYVIDRDSAGLNVRAGPSAAAPVLRMIGNQGSGVARIRGQSGAWFRVSIITDAESDENLFRGDGWIHFSLLALDVANADPNLYASPRPHSRALARLVPEDGQATLIGCDGHWARIRARGRVGWLSPGGQCSNPLTTCA